MCAQGTAWQEVTRGSGWWGGQSMAVVTVKGEHSSSFKAEREWVGVAGRWKVPSDLWS